MKSPKALRRERINKALEKIVDYPLTLIEAPIGYGKTTAVRQFLAVKGYQSYWISFHDGEDTTAFFWDNLSKAVELLDKDTGEKLKNLGFPSDAPQLANILSILNRMICKENTILVLDDYHLVKDPFIFSILEPVIKEEIQNLHIVIITRNTTKPDVVELTAKGLCNIVSQQVLRFTIDEIRDYCMMVGQMPTESELAKYTGGWISLVYLILLGLEKGIPMGLNIAINDLVNNIIYKSYDEQIRQFLLKLAILDSFTEEQALVVTQEKRADEFLKKLRRENAFVTYDETAGIYRIHNVMLDFLRKKQKVNTDMKALYRAVGGWYLGKKEYVTAFGYLYRGGETQYILSQLNNEGNITGELAEFDGWFEMFSAIPRKQLLEYPIAYLQYICSMLFVKNDIIPEDIEKHLDELEKICRGKEDIQEELKNRILAEISVTRIFAVFNDPVRMIECIKQAASLLKGRHSCLIQRKAEFTFGSPHFLYAYYRKPGMLKQTTERITKGFPSFARVANGCGTGCEYVALAEYALETGDWPGAELNATKAIYKARTMDQTGISICAGFTLIRLLVLQGKAADGLERLKKLRNEVAKENNAVYNTTMDLCDGYIYGCLGQLERIPLWLQTGDISSARFLNQGMGFNYIVYGKAVMLSRNYVELEMLAETFDSYFSILNNQLGFIHNRIFEAVAKYRLYGMETGCAALRKALNIGHADHVILPFAENASAIVDMLRFMVKTSSYDQYVETILFYCERYLDHLKQVNLTMVTLSAREKEVLVLAAEGLMREEIAGRLKVSTGTIRTHLQNIYQKLDVGCRTAAVRKAEKLMLI